jgi:hypothetical protein
MYVKRFSLEGYIARRLTVNHETGSSSLSFPPHNPSIERSETRPKTLDKRTKLCFTSLSNTYY